MKNTQPHPFFKLKYTLSSRVTTPDGNHISGLYIYAYDQDSITNHYLFSATFAINADNIDYIVFT